MNLETTNWLLGIIAAATALQTLLLVGVAIVGYRWQREISATIRDLEVRHVEPLRHRVDGILVDVQTIASRVSHRTERVDDVIAQTMERVDETTGQVRDSVRDKVAQATGILRGIRAVIESLLTTVQPDPPAAAGRRG
jgi:hypothetical protein